MDYAKWLQNLDAILTDIYGCGHRDLPDSTWMDMFEDGLTPTQAVDTYKEETGDWDQGEDQSPGDVMGYYDERQEF